MKHYTTVALGLIAFVMSWIDFLGGLLAVAIGAYLAFGHQEIVAWVGAAVYIAFAILRDYHEDIHRGQGNP